MRSDPAMLARLQLQSTSDQQNFLRYPPIAAAAPVAVNPEQCAHWAYPQPTFTTEEIGFTLCGAMLGRLYLSGHLDQMNSEQLELVADAARVYKRIRPHLADGVPYWPDGLPKWDDPCLSVGLRTPSVSYVLVWHRSAQGGIAGAESPAVSLSIAHLAGVDVEAKAIFPSRSDAGLRWDPASGRLQVRLPAAPAACLIALSPAQR